MCSGPKCGACWLTPRRTRWSKTLPANGWKFGAWNRHSQTGSVFPDFDEYLRSSMIKETELFFQYVMQRDRSVLDFINGPYSFLNERLARHYGIRRSQGAGFPESRPDMGPGAAGS